MNTIWIRSRRDKPFRQILLYVGAEKRDGYRSDANIAQDTILWVHILIQTLAWGVLFPTGMVLGVHFPLYASWPPI